MAKGHAQYHHYDLLLALLLHQRQRGRKDVSRELFLGEGSVKALLNDLKGKGLLQSTTKGHILTEKGKYMVGKLVRIITINFRSRTKLFGKLKETAILVKDPNLKLYPRIYRSRDEVIRKGAEDAIFAVKKKNRFVLPPIGYTEKKFMVFRKLFDMTGKDLLIVSYAKDRRIALLGAMAGAVSISLSLNKILKTIVR